MGNGGLAPEWRMSIRLKGAKIEYGPWADRQRCDAVTASYLLEEAAYLVAPHTETLSRRRSPRLSSLMRRRHLGSPPASRGSTPRSKSTLSSRTRAPWRFPPESRPRSALLQARRWVIAAILTIYSLLYLPQDWEYDSSSSSKLHSQRRFGWLALKVGALSRIEYNMPLVASPEGYKSSLKVDLTKLSVSSSVTSQDFIHAGHSNVRRPAFLRPSWV